MEERLIKFAGIIDAGSFTQAAQQLHISQPALTAAIQKLERELHKTLVVRTRHSLNLTPAGEHAYATGKALAAHTSSLKARLAGLAGEKLPIKIGMIDSLAETLFVHTQELRRLEEWAHVSLTIHNSATLLDQVAKHTLDIACIVQPQTVRKSLATTPLGVEPLILVAHRRLAPGLQDALSQGRLPQFLSYNQASTTHDMIVQAAARKDISLQPRFYSTSPDIMLSLVLAGEGCAILPYQKVKPHVDEALLEPLCLGRLPLIERPLVAIQQNGNHVPEQLNATLDAAKQQLARLMQEAREVAPAV